MTKGRVTVTEQQKTDPLRKPKVELQGILVAEKQPITAKDIERRLKNEYGETLDPKKYGCNTLDDLLQACSDTIVHQRRRDGVHIYMAKISEANQEIVKKIQEKESKHQTSVVMKRSMNPLEWRRKAIMRERKRLTAQTLDDFIQKSAKKLDLKEFHEELLSLRIQLFYADSFGSCHLISERCDNLKRSIELFELQKKSTDFPSTNKRNPIRNFLNKLIGGCSGKNLKSGNVDNSLSPFVHSLLELHSKSIVDTLMLPVMIAVDIGNVDVDDAPNGRMNQEPVVVEEEEEAENHQVAGLRVEAHPRFFMKKRLFDWLYVVTEVVPEFDLPQVHPNVDAPLARVILIFAIIDFIMPNLLQ